MCSKVPHSYPQALHGAEARLDLASAKNDNNAGLEMQARLAVMWKLPLREFCTTDGSARPLPEPRFNSQQHGGRKSPFEQHRMCRVESNAASAAPGTTHCKSWRGKDGRLQWQTDKRRLRAFSLTFGGTRSSETRLFKD